MFVETIFWFHPLVWWTISIGTDHDIHLRKTVRASWNSLAFALTYTVWKLRPDLWPTEPIRQLNREDLVKNSLWLIVVFTAVVGMRAAVADTTSTCTMPSGAISCTGTLGTPEDVFEKDFMVTGGADIEIQTFGFGGGTNAAGNSISAGGFDSLIALFSGPPETILTDLSGNPIASDPSTTQFFPGCGPAGTVVIGSTPVCGDNRYTVGLMPGTYVLLLSDADYMPFAFNPGPPASLLLSDGFADLTGGAFQTCTSSADCRTDSGNFAVDIRALQGQISPVPEPDILGLLGIGLAAFVYRNGNRGEFRLRKLFY
jgi:hypothetical protein